MESRKKAKSMLVILTKQQILPTKQVCNSCLMADSGGLPRWRKGELCCGHLIDNPQKDSPQIYECQMGFHLTNVN